jgi:hypothetical protein
VNEPETLYSSPFEPDRTNALHVLAFLLVPESAFLSPGDDEGVRAAVHEVLSAAKRDALLDWYRANFHVERKESA